MKKVGIYLNYPPQMKFKQEGLGRLLANIIKGGTQNDYLYVIACPSWLKKNLRELLTEEQIDLSKIRFIGPKNLPFSLQLYEFLINFKPKKNRNILKVWSHKLKELKSRCIGIILAMGWLEIILTNLLLILIISSGLYFFSWFKFFLIFIFIIFLLKSISRKLANKIVNNNIHYLTKIKSNLFNIKQNFSFYEMYESLSSVESKKILNAISKEKDVLVWFSPTAFWPEFNKIQGAKIMVVPDVVLESFPVGFAKVMNKVHEKNLDKIRTAISNCDYFITYSEEVKYSVLVDRFHKIDKNVKVIKHGWINLEEFIDFKIKRDLKLAQKEWSIKLTQALAVSYLYKNFNHVPCNEFKYIFYASQARPNKNIHNLIKVFSSLVHNNFITHKLILTCKPTENILNLVESQDLIGKVVFTPGATQMELALLFSGADIAVNPSLSEGGFPFTFSEALSVDTPIVMSDIAVTREVLDTFPFSKRMLFDPLDLNDIKVKLLDCIENKKLFLNNQKVIADSLKKRTWKDVAKEYNDFFEKIFNEVGDRN